MIYDHTIVPTIFLPVGVTLVALWLGLAFRRRWLVWIAVLVLWTSSTPLVSGLLVDAVERGHQCN